MTGTPLTDVRQEKFARAIAQGMLQQDAYVAAGYKKGTSVDAHASRLRHTPHVAARIAELCEPAVKKVTVSIEMLVRTFLEQGTFDPGVFAEVNSPQELVRKVDEETRRLLVQGWSWDKQGRFRLELVKKSEALDRLARHVSLYNDTIKFKDDFAVLLEEAQRRHDERSQS